MTLIQSSTANYAAVIQDLKAKRAELDRTIATLEAMVSVPAPEAPVTPSTSPVARSTAANPYDGMGIGEATLAVLRTLARPLTNRDIVDHLSAHGYAINSNEPVNNVGSALNHRAKIHGDVIREGRFWRLASKEVVLAPQEPTLNGVAH